MEYTSNILEIGSLIKLEEGLTVDKVTNNVGIGTTSPDAPLTVYKSSSSPTLLAKFENPSGQAIIKIASKNDALAILDFGDPEDGNVGAIQYDHLGNSMRFKTNDSERIRIDSTGNVGIGTSSPTQRLDVSTSSGEAYIRVNSAANQDSGYRIAEGGTNKWLLYNIASLDALSVYDNTANAERMRIDSSGNLSLTSGNIALSASGGIYFDNAASKYLDDYEIGIFTPTITATTSGTITLRTGYTTMAYTKIGRIVNIQGQIGISGVSSPTGQIRISLPFAAGSGTHLSEINGGTVSWYDDSAGAWQGTYGLAGADTLNFPIASLGAFDFLLYSITYYTDL